MSKLLLVVVLLFGLSAAQESLPQADTAAAFDPNRTVLVFLSQRFFSEEAVGGLRAGLKEFGLATKTVARDTGLCISMDMTVLRPDFVLADVRVEDFRALALADGSGAILYWADTLLHALCRRFIAACKPVASVGVANVVLARAGLLKGKKATILAERNAVAELKAAGATYVANPVVTDGLLLTAADSENSEELGKVLGHKLGGR